MPFKSEKQRRYLWSQKPEIAAKFERDSLPWTHKTLREILTGKRKTNDRATDSPRRDT